MFPADVANNIEKATKALNNYKTTINDLNNKISGKKSELEKY
jgi:flagellar hook-associated protein FlgK